MKVDNMFRDPSAKTRKRVDAELDELVGIHNGLLPPADIAEESEIKGDGSVFTRLALSCLADADHGDTARHYGEYPEEPNMPKLLPTERLERLDAYVANLARDSDRSALRMKMYEACRGSDVKAAICACDGSVGVGKTTSHMAFGLKKAIDFCSRRMFVVVPYANIISQTVKVYRKVLVLDGEDPESVVAELHHLADFESEDMRHLSAQWKAPIIVTTAVAFFETLASNRPAVLRKLHELPGSVIIMDESHAAMPVKLLPLAWHWMNVLADEWSCRWILSSGTLVRFWDIPELIAEKRQVPYIVGEPIRAELMRYEKKRVKYPYEPTPLSVEALMEKVAGVPGPRMVTVNTMQSAAYVALKMQKKYGERAVMHISNALSAQDRESTLDAIKRRLKNKADTEWMLVATTCVENGVEITFRNGFREFASALSLLQAAGRINRNGDEDDCAIWSFAFQDDPYITKNPAFFDSASVLLDFLGSGAEITPQLCTLAIAKESEKQNLDNGSRLLRLELDWNFEQVREKFHIIESDTVLVAADEETKALLRSGSANWIDIQRKCVSVRRSYVKKYGLVEICEGIYDWSIGYDSFIGVMKGVLDEG